MSALGPWIAALWLIGVSGKIKHELPNVCYFLFGQIIENGSGMFSFFEEPVPLIHGFV